MVSTARWKLALTVCLIPALCTAQSDPRPAAPQTSAAAAQGPEVYKKLRLQELMDIEVTSVSRRPEKLTGTASAIQVITRDDIRRSGATRLPEVLRLASNLEVSQLDSNQWAISARGFNSGLGNKMLVLIDGRTVYSPLFAGVFWDMQDVLLEDVERIEVISGPGAALWGANAVNGVINIITRSTKDTLGGYLEGGGGLELRGLGGLRYGAALAPNLWFRIYGKYTDRDGIVRGNGTDLRDDYRMGQGGVRLDWERSEASRFTLQGDFYENRAGVSGTNDTEAVGANVLGRWSHTLSETSDFTLQIYFDRAHRDVATGYNDVLDTYDADFQHRLAAGSRNDMVWGAGYRLIKDDFEPRGITLLPRRRTLQKFSTFFQDEIAIVADRLHLTLGAKVEHNDYSGFEFQPSARLAWKFSQRQTLWGAVSRAVRTPSRLDRELFVPGNTASSSGFDSEKLFAYELGHRIQPYERLSVSLAGFYNDYDDIRSVERVNPPAALPAFIGNGQEGESYGAELTADYRVTDWWHLRPGYTELRVHIRRKPGSTDFSAGATESADSNHHFFLRSSLDFARHFQFDPMFRYISRITHPSLVVPGYSELNLRLAWLPRPEWEFSVVGQNVLHDRHFEYGTATARRAIQRTVFGKFTFRW